VGRVEVSTIARHLYRDPVGAWTRIVSLDRDMRLAGNTAKHRELIAFVFFYSISFLVIGTGARYGTISRYPLLIVDTVICSARRAERKLLAHVLARVWFLKVTW